MAKPDEINNHKQLLAALTKRLEDEELPWYEGRSSSNNVWWYFLVMLSLLLSIATSAVAAIITPADFGGVGRLFLVILPILGAGVSSLIQIFRFREREALRETGRIEVSDIIANAKSFLVTDGTEEYFRERYHAVRQRFHVLELSQHQGDAALRSEPTPAGETQRDRLATPQQPTRVT